MIEITGCLRLWVFESPMGFQGFWVISDKVLPRFLIDGVAFILLSDRVPFRVLSARFLMEAVGFRVSLGFSVMPNEILFFSNFFW